MTLTRRAFIRASTVPLLGALPFSRTAEQTAPDPVRTRLILGGDVMLSRHVGRVARAQHDPAFPLRDLAPVLRSADIAFVNLESPFSDHGPVVERGMIFKAVRDGRPYPDHGYTLKDWADIPPRPVRLDQLVTTKLELGLDRVLANDSTFYGDLFPHVVEWEGELYLEDGLHRALRAALQQRNQIHVRVLVLS